jgi:hypothetical protein
LLAAFLPPYAFSWEGGRIVVDVAASFWGWNTDRLFNMLLHELFHNGFVFHQPGVSLTRARNSAALVRTALWHIQNEGLATYVAYRAKPHGLALPDYRLLEDANEVRSRFRMLHNFLRAARRAERSQMWHLRQRLWKDGNVGRMFYIVGAYMARQIERRKGRRELVETIIAGPRAFFEVYRRTSPPRGYRVEPTQGLFIS